jgi:hypothetical protein
MVWFFTAVRSSQFAEDFCLPKRSSEPRQLFPAGRYCMSTPYDHEHSVTYMRMLDARRHEQRNSANEELS